MVGFDSTNDQGCVAHPEPQSLPQSWPEHKPLAIAALAMGVAQSSTKVSSWRDGGPKAV